MDYWSLRRTVKGWSINGLEIVIQNAKEGHIQPWQHTECCWFSHADTPGLNYAILKASFMDGLFL